MTFANSIQSISGAHTPSGSGNTQCAPDWDRSRVFFRGTYLARGGLITGTEEEWSVLTAYNASTVSPVGLDSDGNVYLCTNDAGYYRGISQINGETLALITTSLEGQSNEGQGGFANITVGATQYMLDNGVGGGIFAILQHLKVYSGSTLLNQEDWPSGAQSYVCTGKPGTNKGFMLNGPNASIQTQILTLSSITGGGVISFAVEGTVAPTAVDAAWTEIYPKGICCDQTDGHILVAVSGQSGATQRNYIIKISSDDASVLWVCPVPVSGAITSGGGHQMAYSRIKNQRFALLTNGLFGSPPTTVTLIDTSDGSSTTLTGGLAGISAFGPQSYDDTLGGILCSLFFNETTGSPTRLNSTPSSYTGWFVLYVDTAIAPPAPATDRSWEDLVRPISVAQ